MAIRKEDRVLITEEIHAAIKEHLNPHGWRKAREFIPLVGVLTIFIGLLALAGSGWNYAFSRVATEAQFQAHTTDTLARIGERLVHLEAILAVSQAQALSQKYSAAAPQELKKHHEELATIKATLATTPTDTPNFWPASFQIITLLSQAQATELLETIGKGPLSIIEDVTINAPPTVFGPRIKQNVLLKKSVIGFSFIDCVIHLDPSAQLANDTFTNCVFIFPSEPNPPRNLQQIGSELLAADLSHAFIKGS